MPSSGADKLTPRQFARQFALVFSPSLAVVVGLLWFLYYNDQAADDRVLRANQIEHVKVQSEAIRSELRSAVADLMVLSEGRTLAALLDDDTPPHRRTVEIEFKNFLEQKALFDQVRLIDADGRESIRVNLHQGRGVVVPPEKLQSKRSRYYFAYAMELDRGGVFVSPFDLNVEEEKIEQPIKPTIRFATPVFDYKGGKKGILALNYLGDRLITRLCRNAMGGPERPMLLNDKGYWLINPDRQRNWGFMYPEGQQWTLAKELPDVWHRIATNEEGQFEGSTGLITFATVSPFAEAQIKPATLAYVGTRSTPNVASSYQWKIAAIVDPDMLGAERQRLQARYFLMGAGLTLLLLFLSGLLARAQILHRLAQQQMLRKARLAAVAEAMAGLAHESRNALQRSQGGLEMIRKRVNDQAEVVELLDEVQKAQYALRDLYEDVRGYAASSALRYADIDLGEIFDDSWKHLKAEHSGLSILVGHRGRHLNLRCRADGRGIDQVFRNILENALQASSHPELQIVWEETMLPAGRAAVQISIRDNGPGFGVGAADHIFEAFYTTKPRGMGLGLAICRRIIEAHGGTIAARDVAGAGTEIVVIIPRSQA